jgi:hypothetical protein
VKGIATDNVLDFALNAFSAPNEEGLYEVVQNASTEQIASVLEQYRTWAAQGIIRAPRLLKGELRPYFVTSSGFAAWAQGGLDNRNGFKDQAAIWAAVDSIKHRLLYCHSVAIDDATGWLLYRNELEKTDDTRDRLLSYINFLLHMAPLLRHGILCPVTSELYLPDNDSAITSHWNHVRDHLVTQLDDDTSWTQISIDEFRAIAPDDVQKYWAREFPTSSSQAFLQRAMFYNSCERVGRALAATANAPDKLTTYLPFRFDVEVLSAYQKSVSNRVQSEISKYNLRGYDNWLVSHLIDVELPSLGELNPEDLVQIRSNSHEFEEWRNTLRDAIRCADNLPPDIGGDRNTEVREEIARRLEDGRARLESSLPKLTLRKGLKSATVTMSAGAITSVVSLLVNPTMTAAAILAQLTAAAASSIFLGATKATEGEATKAREAARAHYVAVLR